jgi:hypothetical protein
VWTEIPRICVRDCSCFWGSLSNDKLGSFPKASELLGCGSEDNDSAPSPLLASSACTDTSRLFGKSLAAVNTCACCAVRCSAALLPPSPPAEKACHACCGIVRNCCCDVSALTTAVLRLPTAPLASPKPAIACKS